VTYEFCDVFFKLVACYEKSSRTVFRFCTFSKISVIPERAENFQDKNHEQF